MINFWEKLERPIFALAPLSGVTDSAFRRICREFGADVVYSELASTTALAHNPRLTLAMLRFDESERPYVVQLFGSNPEYFAKSAKLVTEVLQPDGIDINFGCPVAKVIRQGAGAALMANLPQAREVISAVIDNTHLPVSIKTRIKAKDVEIADFLEYMTDLDIKALMLHGRTLTQRFSGPNDFKGTREARRHFPGVFLANGGANNAANGIELLQQTGADGVGVGRGALGRPWIFREMKALLNGGRKGPIAATDIFRVALRHAKMAEELKGRRGILEMRKHLCWYIQSIPDAGKIRQKLAGVNNLENIQEILDSIELP